MRYQIYERKMAQESICIKDINHHFNGKNSYFYHQNDGKGRNMGIYSFNNKKYQRSDSFLLGAILSVSGGFQDAYTYVLRDKVFANAQTGNIVLMSQGVINKDWASSFRYLLPVLAFALGIVASEQIGHRFKHSKKIHWRQIVLLIEAFILAVVAFVPLTHNVIANVLVSFACAMQVQAFRKLHGYAYATTMCIGNLRSGTESLSIYFRERNKESLIKAFHYYGIIFLFAIGAGVGATISSHYGIKSIISSAVLLIIGFFVMLDTEEK